MLTRFTAGLRQHPFSAVQIGLLLGAAVALRFVDLGYSEFQGDEINALCRASKFDGIVRFLGYLLSRRKGPIQYSLTCAYSLVDPAFSSEFAVRLPFAIASLLAVICFFLVARRLFNLRVGIFAGALYATNGIFIGQARFAQYQSIVQLGTTAALMGFVLAIDDQRWRASGLYLGTAAAAVALLAHFDGVFALLPMAVLAVHWWIKYKDQPGFDRLRWHIAGAVGLYVCLVLPFYSEYALRLQSFQLEYWAARFRGAPTDTVGFFRFFNPGPVAWMYLVATALAISRIRKSMGWQVALAWILPPLIFIEAIFSDSRASMYTYLLPLSLIAGIGFDSLLDWIEELSRRQLVRVVHAGMLGLFIALAYVSYSLVVDHTPEYPWQSKTVLGLRAKGGYLNGLFGVPYWRGWRDMGAWLSASPLPGRVVATNEKLVIAQFYLPAGIKYKYIWRDSLQDLPREDGVFVLVINHPQSFMNRLWGWSFEEWHDKLPSLYDSVNENGEIVASIYYVNSYEMREEFR